MWERHQRFVAPAVDLVDRAAVERIGAQRELSLPQPVTVEVPTLIVAGRQDSTVGYAVAADLLESFPHANLAVVDGAGHALPHEQPEATAELIPGWLSRTDPVGSDGSADPR